MYKSRDDTQDNHRDSIEQLRAVGQTFVDGLSALRDRVSATTITDSSSETGAQNKPGNSMSGNSDAVSPMAAETIPQESGDAHEKDQERMVSSRELPAPSPGPSISSSPSRSPAELQREVDRLQNMLFATERKLEARAAECTDLKATAGRLGSRHERDMRQLETLRSEVRTARETGDIERERAERAVAEAARLRTELVDVERELARQTAECDELRRVSLGQKQKIAGLERVMMGLRRRVAMADGQVEAAKRAESAVAARHAAESALVEARAQLERFRARVVAVDSLRERATAAEHSERELRDKVALLEREIESKDAVVRQDLAERRKLNEFMIRYEKQLEEKEATISSLRRQLRQLRVPETDLLETRWDDGRANASLPLSETGSARSLTWDNGVGRNFRRAPSDSNFDSMVSYCLYAQYVSGSAWSTQMTFLTMTSVAVLGFCIRELIGLTAWLEI